MKGHQKLRYFVHAAGGRIAAFINEHAACRFAKDESARFDWITEVEFRSAKGGGLIAQYQGGVTTPEFQFHERSRLARGNPDAEAAAHRMNAFDRDPHPGLHRWVTGRAQAEADFHEALKKIAP